MSNMGRSISSPYTFRGAALGAERLDAMIEPRTIYFDHAATTSLDPRVLQSMLPYLQEDFGNASTGYAAGRMARKAIDASRDQVARLVGCRSSEILFTSGGSESDNLAIKGVAMALRGRGNHIVTSAVEHHAVLRTCEFLERHLGFDVTFVGVDGYGRVDVRDVERALRPDTILVSVMQANNEVGTLQPIEAIAKVAHARGIVVHTDAVQGGASLDIEVETLGVDLLSLSAHKFGGPKGVGMLYVRGGTPLLAQQQGGAQELGLRAGTENTAGIVGAAAALELARANRVDYVARCSVLRDRLIGRVLARVAGAVLTGHPTERLANSASFAFAEADGEALLMALDSEGVAASIGSACSSGTLEVSHVLQAMGLVDDEGGGSLRITLGPENTIAEVDAFLSLLPDVVERARTARAMTVG